MKEHANYGLRKWQLIKIFNFCDYLFLFYLFWNLHGFCLFKIKFVFPISKPDIVI